MADEFNARNPERNSITHIAEGKLVKTFKETGSVVDKPRVGRASVGEDIRTGVIAKFHASPKKSFRQTSTEVGLPKSTMHDILEKEKFHPYKLQILYRLTENDPDRRLEMCEWFLRQISEDENFLEGVMFSDEANFYVSGEVNKQNFRYWSPEKPHWFTDSKEQGAHRLMVWCGLWDIHVTGPLFFENTVHGDKYLEMLGDKMVPELDLIGEQPKWFMQDGAPPHYATSLRH
jgi:hypothetical protein